MADGASGYMCGDAVPVVPSPCIGKENDLPACQYTAFFYAQVADVYKRQVIRLGRFDVTPMYSVLLLDDDNM